MINTASKIFQNPVIKIGALLGGAYVLALYLFYFGGRSVIMDSSFDSVIQLLTIMGLYFGLHHCRRLFPKARFWKLFLFGIIIMLVAVGIRALFSMLLYGLLAPELGNAYKEMLSELMSKVAENIKAFPQEEYKAMTKSMLNAITIPILEGFGLLFSGIIFSLFIAALHNMFRK